MPAGEATATIGGGTNLAVTSPGKLLCEGEFNASSGVALGGGKFTGSMTFQCIGNEDPTLFYGFTVTIMTKPVAGASFPLGQPGSVAMAGGYAYNGEAALDYEESPRCQTKQGHVKAWTSTQHAGATGTLVLDAVNGAKIIFHIEKASLPVEKNDSRGTGTLQLSANGAFTVVGL